MNGDYASPEEVAYEAAYQARLLDEQIVAHLSAQHDEDWAAAEVADHYTRNARQTIERFLGAGWSVFFYGQHYLVAMHEY